MQKQGAFLVATVPIPKDLVDYERLDETAMVQAQGYGSMVLPPEEWERTQVDVQLGEEVGSREAEELRAANTYGGARREATGQEEVGTGGLGGLTPPWMGMPSWMHPHLEQPHEQGAVATAIRQGGGQEADGRDGGDEGVAARVTGEEDEAEGAGRAGSKVDRGAHFLAFVGPLVYCRKCAVFAHHRVGTGIRGICTAPSNKRANAVVACLRRLRSGSHPISGRPLT
jgi:hypothetical protein